MDPLFAKLHKAAEDVHLDMHTKEGFRRTLEMVTMQPAAPMQSGYRLPRAVAWAMAAVIAATSGAGVTYASTKAVPGDTLYSVKVHVVEPTESALALSESAKEQVAIAHIQRRFQEAAELSANGKLEQHDEQLAAVAADDIAAVDREDKPEVQAQFKALAATYAPTLRLQGMVRGKFARAVRIDVVADAVSDDVAKTVAVRQVALVRKERTAMGERRMHTPQSVSKRLEAADRLTQAADDELQKGSFQSALELSGAAVKLVNEAQFISDATTSTTSTVATTTTSTTSTEEYKDQEGTEDKKEGILQDLLR